MPDQRAQALLPSRSSLRASQETESQEQPHGSSWQDAISTRPGPELGHTGFSELGEGNTLCAHPVVTALKTLG